jgi:hypothetical protein
MFQGYRCWKQADLQAVAQIEAGSFEHGGAEGADAVFLATHQPTKLRKGGSLVDESALLSDFCKPIAGEQRLVFVVGKRGTGKSHIVKWLQARIGDHPDWHEVYIEKRNTSLQRVIETILKGLEGPRISDLKERLQQNARSLRTVDEAKQKLLLELAFLVGTADPTVALTGPNRETFSPQHVGHLKTHLPTLLLDAVTRRILLRPGGSVERITKLAFEGTGQDDVNEADLQLTEDDLPLQPEDLANASKEARDIIRQLGTVGELRRAAVAMLNRHLATAKALVFMGRGVDLVGVFEEVRQELAQKNLELCLFIEDLVLLHGIDQELAHVLTIGQGTDEEKPLCALRAAIAVTDGYLDDIETLKSRGVRYSLDLRLGTADLPQESARSFVARYLNAARLGPAVLVDERRKAEGGDWVPNHCTPRFCPYVEECHASFGRSAEGYGYYPLNDKAVDRLVALASRHIAPHFDPRYVIRDAIRDPLEVAWDELKPGLFPSERFAAPLDGERANVAPEVKVAIKRRDDPSAERRVSLLSFWNGGADTLVNVHPVIHSAFALPPLEGIEEGGGQEDYEEEEHDEDEAARRDRKKRTAAFNQIDAWSVAKETLSSDVAGVVRQSVLDAVVYHLMYGPSGVKVTAVPGKSRWRIGSLDVDLRTVYIEDSQGGATDVDLPFRISFDRSAENAVLFKSIWRAQRESWAFESDGSAYAAFADVVAASAEELRRFATRSTGVDLVPALELLTISARLRDSLPDALDEVPAALFAPPGAAVERSGGWARLRQASDAGRRAGLVVLRDELSAAKGRGSPSVLDVAPILGPLGRLGKVKQLTGLRGTQDLVERLKNVMKAQQAAAEAEWSRLSRPLASLTGLIGEDDRWDDLQKAVTAAVDEANGQGYLPVAEARDDLAALRDAVDARQLEQFRRLVKEQPAAGAAVRADSIWTLVPDPGPGLERLRAYLQRAKEILEYVQRRIADRHAQTAGGGLAVSAVVDELRRLGDELDALAKEG